MLWQKDIAPVHHIDRYYQLNILLSSNLIRSIRACKDCSKTENKFITEKIFIF
jgi:hypothetical protein